MKLDTVPVCDEMGPDVQHTKEKNMCIVWDFLNNTCEGLQ